MLGVVSVRVLASHPMQAVVVVYPEQFGTPTRLARRSFVLANAGLV